MTYLRSAPGYVEFKHIESLGILCSRMKCWFCIGKTTALRSNVLAPCQHDFIAPSCGQTIQGVTVLLRMFLFPGSTVDGKTSFPRRSLVITRHQRERGGTARGREIESERGNEHRPINTPPVLLVRDGLREDWFDRFGVHKRPPEREHRPTNTSPAHAVGEKKRERERPSERDTHV